MRAIVAVLLIAEIGFVLIIFVHKKHYWRSHLGEPLQLSPEQVEELSDFYPAGDEFGYSEFRNPRPQPHSVVADDSLPAKQKPTHPSKRDAVIRTASG